MEIFILFINDLTSLVSLYLHFKISYLSFFCHHPLFYLGFSIKSTSIRPLCQLLLYEVFALKRWSNTLLKKPLTLFNFWNLEHESLCFNLWLTFIILCENWFLFFIWRTWRWLLEARFILFKYSVLPLSAISKLVETLCLVRSFKIVL